MDWPDHQALRGALSLCWSSSRRQRSPSREGHLPGHSRSPKSVGPPGSPISAPCPQPASQPAGQARRPRRPREQQVQDAGVAGTAVTQNHALLPGAQPASATALLPLRAGASLPLGPGPGTEGGRELRKGVAAAEPVTSCPSRLVHGPRAHRGPPGRPAGPKRGEPTTRLRSGPGPRPQSPAPPQPGPVRTALPPGLAARSRSRPRPGRLPGALQSAHTSARGPFRDILGGDAASALWASVGGAGGGPGRRRRPLLPAWPAPARPRFGSARPANRPSPGPAAARAPARPPARSPSGALRPAPPRAAPPPLAVRSLRLLQEAAQARPIGEEPPARPPARRPAPRAGPAGRASRRKEARSAGASGRRRLKAPRWWPRRWRPVRAGLAPAAPGLFFPGPGAT